MSLPIPVDIIEEIIDSVHDLGDVKSLRNLVLTSHSFLRRSRYHLFSSHIRLGSIKKLNSFCDFLDAHPDRKPWVRSVTICSTEESPSLPEVVPVRLLANLPSLEKWRISTPFRGSYNGGPRQRISSNTSKLTCLGHYAQLITHLHLEHVHFQSCADFARYILAFPGLRHLRCEWLEFQHKDHATALVRAREHLSKGLRLSHLTVYNVPKVVATLLLESVHHTLQELVINATNCRWLMTRFDAGEPLRRLELGTSLLTPLILPLSKLSSITLQAWFLDFGDTDGNIERVVEILQALASNPDSLITQIAVHLHDREINQLLEYLRDHSDDLEQACRTLETALLRLPRLQKIEFCHYLRRPIRSWTRTRLERFLPTLQKRGLIDVRCLTPPIQGHSDGVIALAMSPDGRWVASCSSDTTIILWDAQRSTIAHEWPAHLGGVTSLAFSRDGRHLASVGYDRKVMVWDVSEGTESEMVLVTTLEDANVCVWSPDGTIHALAREGNGTVQVWNPSTNQVQLHSLEGYSGNKWRTTIFSPDGHWVAASGNDSCKVWDATTGRLHKTLPGISGDFPLDSTAFDPVGRRIAIPFDNDSIRIWDVETGDQLVVLQSDGTRGIIHNITFSPSGTRVLSTGSGNTMVRLWDSFSGDVLLSFRGHEGEVIAACFSPDEKYVASASYDHTVRLWSASTGSCIKTFTEHDDIMAWCVEFSRDGEILVSGGLDGRVCMRRLRDVCPEEYSGDA